MRSILRISAAFMLLMALSNCAKVVYDSDFELARYNYVSPDQPSLTLMTMVNNKNGSGGHSSLVIDGGPQRIMYDPAGRWFHSWVPERNDVLFGLTPALLQRYKSFHARDTHHVVSQTIPVSSAIAQQAYALAMAQGASHDAMCSQNTSAILVKLAGFESVGRPWGPAVLMKNFGKLPGVVTDKYYETDSGQN